MNGVGMSLPLERENQNDRFPDRFPDRFAWLTQVDYESFGTLTFRSARFVENKA